MINTPVSICGTDYVLRMLEHDDANALADYFASLSAETRRRFAPHPLDAQTAHALCARVVAEIDRFVLADCTTGKLIGYFVMDYTHPQHEADRLRAYGFDLQAGLDPRFAPSVDDGFQGRGIASAVMPLIMDSARARGARTIVLMGGTQATNARAVAFYRRFDFKEYGGYQTEVFNQDMVCTL